jgi:hypothetical protein
LIAAKPSDGLFVWSLPRSTSSLCGCHFENVKPLLQLSGYGGNSKTHHVRYNQKIGAIASSGTFDLTSKITFWGRFAMPGSTVDVPLPDESSTDFSSSESSDQRLDGDNEDLIIMRDEDEQN